MSDPAVTVTPMRILHTSDWHLGRTLHGVDLLDAPVDRPMIQETTALGAAYLAGLAAGVYPEPEKFADNWRLVIAPKGLTAAQTAAAVASGPRPIATRPSRTA